MLTNSFVFNGLTVNLTEYYHVNPHFSPIMIGKLNSGQNLWRNRATFSPKKGRNRANYITVKEQIWLLHFNSLLNEKSDLGDNMTGEKQSYLLTYFVNLYTSKWVWFTFHLRMFVFHQVQKSPHSGECRDNPINFN